VTRDAIRRLNRQLKSLGERICPSCEARYPLTETHWYFFDGGNGRRGQRPNCKACERMVDNERYRRRYYGDADWRARRIQSALRWRSANRERFLRRHREDSRRARTRRKLRRFVRVLDSAREKAKSEAAR